MRYVSSVVRSMLRGPVRLAQMALAWVWTTALGRLVVPDVNMIPNGSMGTGARSTQWAASPKRVSNASKPWADSSVVGGSPLLSSVTAIHFNAGAAATTIAAYCGCVIAATAPVCSAKYVTSAPTDLVFVVTATAPSVAQASQDNTISGQFSE